MPNPIAAIIKSRTIVFIGAVTRSFFASIGLVLHHPTRINVIVG
jgi:hypothetical protein